MQEGITKFNELSKFTFTHKWLNQHKADLIASKAHAPMHLTALPSQSWNPPSLRYPCLNPYHAVLLLLQPTLTSATAKSIQVFASAAHNVNWNYTEKIYTSSLCRAHTNLLEITILFPAYLGKKKHWNGKPEIDEIDYF